METLHQALIDLYDTVPEDLLPDRVKKLIENFVGGSNDKFSEENIEEGWDIESGPKTVYPVEDHKHIFANRDQNGGKYVVEDADNGEDAFSYRVRGGVLEKAFNEYFTSEGRLIYTGPAQIALERKAAEESKLSKVDKA